MYRCQLHEWIKNQFFSWYFTLVKAGAARHEEKSEYVKREYSPHWACFLLTVFKAFGRLRRRCYTGTVVPSRAFLKGQTRHPFLGISETTSGVSY
jgi:hypothetical protein